MRQKNLWLSLSVVLLSGSPALAQRNPNDFASLGTLNVAAGVLNINTDTLAMSGAVSFSGVQYLQPDGSTMAVFTFDSISIGAGVTVSMTGTRPIALLSKGNATLSSAIAPVVPPLTDALGGYGGPRVSVGVESGRGPGGGATFPNATLPFSSGGGHGGRGGDATFPVSGGAAYGNLLTQLRGGSSGGVAVGSSMAAAQTTSGSGGGAIEIGAVGTLSVTTITVNGLAGAGANTAFGYTASGGAGGGILLNALGGLTFTSLSANGGAPMNNTGSGGGGGRIALLGQATYTLGAAAPGGISVAGGNNPVAPGYAGTVTIGANVTIIPTGVSAVLTGQPIVSVSGSQNQTSPTIEADIRRSLIIDAGGTATLGMNNALRRLDSGGNNITALTVNGTFNTDTFSQIVSTLSGSGTVNLNTGGELIVGIADGSSLFTGEFLGGGTLTKFGSNTLNVQGTSLASFTGVTNIQGGLLEVQQGSGTATVSSSLRGTGQLAKQGAGTVVLSGLNTYTGGTSIQAGTLVTGSNAALGTNGNVVLSNAAGVLLHLNGYSVTIGSLNGGGGSGGTVDLASGTLILGGGHAFGTFSGTLAAGAGNLVKIGNGQQVLAGTNSYAGTTTINEGTLRFDSNLNGAGGAIIVNGGGTLAGSNATLSRRVLANAGSTIDAVGNLTLGSAARFDGFASHGEIITRANTLTLLDANQATLGEQNTLGQGSNPGTILAANGVFLDFGRGLTGFGTINTPNVLAQRTIINGAVVGNSATEQITFTGWIKGVGTFDNVSFTGTFDPGLSPTIITGGSISFGSTNDLIMELGGTVAGAQYDSIQASGHLAFAGDLDVIFINGFAPVGGESFNLFDWNTSSGTFSSVNLPTLAPGLNWDQSNLYTTGVLSITAVPEPLTLALFGLAGVGSGGTWWWRRRRIQLETAEAEVETDEQPEERGA